MCVRSAKNYLLVKLPVDSISTKTKSKTSINKPIICVPTEFAAVNFSVTWKQVAFFIK